jgi:hypothetical protein
MKTGKHSFANNDATVVWGSASRRKRNAALHIREDDEQMQCKFITLRRSKK